MPYVLFVAAALVKKIVFPVLLGFIILTSTLVGIADAAPVVQHTGGNANSCANLSPNNPNYFTLECAGAVHHDGNDSPTKNDKPGRSYHGPLHV